MFACRFKICLQHTDATGVLFFPQQLQLAMQTLEEFLASKGFPLSSLLTSPYFFPVVHVEADYLFPLIVGDELEITLKVTKMGTSSVTLHYTLQHRIKQAIAGRVEVVHVLVDQKTRSAVPLPDFFRQLFTSETMPVSL